MKRKYTSLGALLLASVVAVGCTSASDREELARQMNRADRAFNDRRYEDAIQGYRAVAAASDGSPGCRGRHYSALLQMGAAYAELDSLQSAREAYRRALSAAPACAAAYAALRRLHEEQGDLQEALRYARKAAARAPDSTAYVYSLGSLLLRTGQAEEAASRFEDVLYDRPSHEGALYSLGQALTQLGQREQAQRYFDKLDSIRSARAAIVQLQKEARRDRKDPMGWLRLGQALERAGRTKEALQTYKMASALAPQSVALKNNIANLMLNRGDTAAAIQQYRAILRQDSTVADVWLNLGVAYANSGELEKARRAWKNALKYDPEHVEAQRYLDRLDTMR